MDTEVEFEPRARNVELPSRGGAMAVLDFGPQERPVDIVFSHANGFNARTYRSILAPLGERLRILALDLRGHGASTLPAVIEGRDGWSEFRDDLRALLAAATEGPVVLAGHSMGATASLLAAAAEPGRAKALVLFDPVLIHTPGRRSEDDPAVAESPLAQGALRRRADFPDKRAALEAYRGRGAFRTWNDAQLADYVEAGFQVDGAGGVTLTCRPEWEASNFRSHNYDPWAAFRATRCPIRILRAEVGSTARLDDHLPELLGTGRIRVETVAGASHFLPMERPELVRQALREAAA
ncbi:alpha/beta hydrolase [Phenylobacterium sp.]|uniref:alpha/beta fold hydrolase n=1 Tax=Phenylobacterium sp. TaxID=1871053 RepID=UPI002C21C630|nr:alpha/beta hydrolase [Phenylobacterium sp.]HVI31871.1 alpha/beta hydrolase [Phenylobacterium sp.]